jgi:hypothetical protein
MEVCSPQGVDVGDGRSEKLLTPSVGHGRSGTLESVTHYLSISARVSLRASSEKLAPCMTGAIHHCIPPWGRVGAG